MGSQRGVGLPELLIALFISSVMMVVLMHQYLNMKRQYLYLQTTLNNDIDLQLVTELIRDSVRKAGFTPCLGINHLTTVDRRRNSKPLMAIEVGFEKNATLRIGRMSETFDTVLKKTDDNHLLITSREPLRAKESILIADCYHAEVQRTLQVKYTAEGQVIDLTKPLAFTYHEPIYVGKWLEETYSIQSIHQRQGSLFYRLHHNEELTSAVHDFSAFLKQHNGGRLLTLVFVLDKGQTLALDTMLRMS